MKCLATGAWKPFWLSDLRLTLDVLALTLLRWTGFVRDNGFTNQGLRGSVQMILLQKVDWCSARSPPRCERFSSRTKGFRTRLVY